VAGLNSASLTASVGESDRDAGRRRFAARSERPAKAGHQANTGGDLVSTWVAKQCSACRGPV